MNADGSLVGRHRWLAWQIMAWNAEGVRVTVVEELIVSAEVVRVS